MVRTRLGRTSPSPSEAWHELTGGADDSGESSQLVAAGGAELGTVHPQLRGAGQRGGLDGGVAGRAADAGCPQDAHLVFFQHDEVLVHCPRADADAVVEAIAEAGQRGDAAAVRRDGRCGSR